MFQILFSCYLRLASSEAVPETSILVKRFVDRCSQEKGKLGEQEQTGEEGYMKKFSCRLVSAWPHRMLWATTVSQWGRAQPLRAVSLVASSLHLSSWSGAQPSWQDTVTQLTQLCLGRGDHYHLQGKHSKQLGCGCCLQQWGSGRDLAAPTTCMLQELTGLAQKIQVTEIACEIPHILPSLGVLELLVKVFSSDERLTFLWGSWTAL